MCYLLLRWTGMNEYIKNVNFFLSDEFQENINCDFQETVYSEETNKKQKQHINKALQLLENVDLIMSSKECFTNISK